jgi:hypothetical protein
MAWKEVTGGQTKYPKYAECKAGDVLADGTYQGTYEGQYGLNYKFSTDDGDVVLGKAGSLGNLMAMVKEGDRCRVVYEGSAIMTKGPHAGKPAHRFKVLVDDEGAPF